MTAIYIQFVGRSVAGGVHRILRDRLAAVERDLLNRFPPAAAANPWQWLGVTSIGGYRKKGGKHTAGAAIDIDYAFNPYIATRTGTTLGGEAEGASLTDIRRAAIDACDRAVHWVHGPEASADLSARGPGEPTGVVWERFARVSNALAAYLGCAFKTSLTEILRPPLVRWRQPTLQDFGAIPVAERYTADEAGQRIFAVRPGEDVNALLLQIVRDYEAVRIPMIFGTPNASPARTRNPARGFMTLPRPLVESLCEVGQLRWGACDFPPAVCGDIMHFDLGTATPNGSLVNESE